MPRPAYDVQTIDLAVARSQTPIPSTQNQPVDSITILQMDSPVQISLGGGPYFTPIVGSTLDMCPPCTEGVLMTNAAGAGSLVVFISMGGASINLNA